MTVPEDIRTVSRPPHTIVCDSGHEGPERYMVRERNSQNKKNGKVIGHIFNGKFILSEGKRLIPYGVPEEASYGGAAVANLYSKDLFEDLTGVFDLDQATNIMTAALVRVLSPGVTNRDLNSEYRHTFLQIYYPDAKLSQNSVGNLLREIGMYPSRCREFYGRRLMRILPDSHIAVDGMLKTDNSKVNTLSEFSHKGREKGSKDISILYAFDIEKMEPVCMEVFPGNRVDSSSYNDFVKNNNLTKGIILDDKGFPPSSISNWLSSQKDLHFITPVRRNMKTAKELSMLDFRASFRASGDDIFYKKERLADGKFLYAFMSLNKHVNEMKGFSRHAMKNELDPHEFEDKLAKSGTVIFESDLDLDPVVVYLCYKERWMIELAFKQYKNLLDLDDTRVHDDYTVMGSEFINFLSSVVSCRILNKAEQEGLLQKLSYGEMMHKLSQAWRRTDDSREPTEGDGSWLCAQVLDYELMEKLGVCKCNPKVSHKKDSQKSKKKKKQSTSSTSSSDVENASQKPTESPAKFVGSKTNSAPRSAKEKSDLPENALGGSAPEVPAGSKTVKTPLEQSTGQVKSEPEAVQPQRGRGRPRIHPLPDPNAPKRPVGRPRIHPLPDPNVPKRPVGRPRIHPLPDPDAPKRPVGRPRIHPLPDPDAPKRPVGRPRKQTTDAAN